MDLEERKKIAWKQFSQYIQAKGGRKTPERESVIKTIVEFRSYFTMEDLEKRLLDHQFKVAKATLYNTVHEMEEAGLVQKMLCDRLARYELTLFSNSPFHQVCSSCGKIKDFNDPELEQLIKTYRLNRFTVESFSLSFHGLCRICSMAKRKKENKNNIQ